MNQNYKQNQSNYKTIINPINYKIINNPSNNNLYINYAGIERIKKYGIELFQKIEELFKYIYIKNSNNYNIKSLSIDNKKLLESYKYYIEQIVMGKKGNRYKNIFFNQIYIEYYLMVCKILDEANPINTLKKPKDIHHIILEDPN
jgi:hypothetical protein